MWTVNTFSYCLHFLCARPRLADGRILLFQLFSEKRTQEPSPERVRSERGREDKPLTPVLYSTREGGELYGAIFFRQGKNTTSVRRISKENFGRRSEKPPPHSCETRSTRSYFSDLSESELAQLFTTDEYESDYFRFKCPALMYSSKMNCLPKPLTLCPKGNATLSFVLLLGYERRGNWRTAECCTHDGFPAQEIRACENQTVFGGKSRWWIPLGSLKICCRSLSFPQRQTATQPPCARSWSTTRVT